jgi:hypothetical protein
MNATPLKHPANKNSRLSLHKLYDVVNNDFYFYPALVAVIILSSYLNYSSTTMSGMLHYYEEFAKLISDGIYGSEIYKTAGSFPMWGYGFILAVTKSKTLIIAFQQLVNLITIVTLDRYLRKKLPGSKWFAIFRIILLISFPVYFFHSILWPYSLSSSFIILGVIALAKFIEAPELTISRVGIILSGICFGIALNFRSDYLYCVFLIYFIFLVFFVFQQRKPFSHVAFMSLWLLTVLLCLTPWAVYTKKVNDHYLLNSTNAGHVLYIGLGQLPGNKWNIIPYDEDSSMKHIVMSTLHPPVYSTTTFAADSVLKKAWMDKVNESPLEYLKKCGYNFLFFFIQPFTEGDGFKDSFSNEDIVTARESIRKMQFGDVLMLFKEKLSPLLVLSLFTGVFSIILMIVFWVTLLRNLRNIPRLISENKLLLLSMLLILYQVGLQTAGYYHRHYNTNIYLLYLAVLIMLLHNKHTLKQSFAGRKQSAKQSAPVE